jgi:FAD/FMN-containing dehydrogenase
VFKNQFLDRTQTIENIDLMHTIKNIFDPFKIMNPNKILKT